MDLIGNRLLTRARFYDALAAAIDAGLPMSQALAASAPQSKAGRELTAALDSDLATGRALSAVLGDRSDSFSSSEVAIVETGERSGRLPEALRRLGDHLNHAAQFRRRLIWSLAYPCGLLHAAILLPTLPILVKSGLGSYLSTVGLLLAILYGIVFSLWFVMDSGLIDNLFLSLPIIGKLQRSRAVADYAFVLGSLFSSGAPLPESLRTAATQTDLQPFRAAGLRVAIAVRSGKSIGEAMADEEDGSGIFGSMFVDQVKIGEVSGKLDEMLVKAETFARDEADQAAKMLAVGLSGLAFTVAALVIAWVILGFWSGYARQLDIAHQLSLIPTSYSCGP